MTFALTGFVQEGAFRVFTFESLPREKDQLTFTVRADLALARKYKIQVQELPLLCRSALEDRADEHRDHALTYTAAEMMLYADRRALVDEKRKAARKPFRPQRTAAVAAVGS